MRLCCSPVTVVMAAGVGLLDQQNSFFGKVLLHVAVFGILLFRTSSDVEKYKNLVDEATFYDRQWSATCEYSLWLQSRFPVNTGWLRCAQKAVSPGLIDLWCRGGPGTSQRQLITKQLPTTRFACSSSLLPVLLLLLTSASFNLTTPALAQGRLSCLSV